MQEAREAPNAGKGTYSFNLTLRDIANAFPSMDQDEMDEALVLLTDDKTAAFLSARHSTMQVRIDTTTDGSVVISPGNGRSTWGRGDARSISTYL